MPASTQSNSTNQDRSKLIFKLLQEILEDVQIRDFHGIARIHFTVQDGIIQSIQSGTEKSVK